MAAGCWLNWQLLRQNGRMLLRLEALEKRIEKFESGREDEPPRPLLESPEMDFGLPDQGANDCAPAEQSKLDSMRRAGWPLRRDAKTRKPSLLTRTTRCIVALAGALVKRLMAGLEKVQSWQVTVQLFRQEYKVPLLPPEIAAGLAAAVELTCPVLLVLGLADHQARKDFVEG